MADVCGTDVLVTDGAPAAPLKRRDADILYVLRFPTHKNCHEMKKMRDSNQNSLLTNGAPLNPWWSSESVVCLVCLEL